MPRPKSRWWVEYPNSSHLPLAMYINGKHHHTFQKTDDITVVHYIRDQFIRGGYKVELKEEKENAKT